MVRRIPMTMSPRDDNGRSVAERIALLRQELPAQYPHVRLDLRVGGDSCLVDRIDAVDADTFEEMDEVGKSIEQLLSD